MEHHHGPGVSALEGIDDRAQAPQGLRRRHGALENKVVGTKQHEEGAWRVQSRQAEIQVPQGVLRLVPAARKDRGLPALGQRRLESLSGGGRLQFGVVARAASEAFEDRVAHEDEAASAPAVVPGARLQRPRAATPVPRPQRGAGSWHRGVAGLKAQSELKDKLGGAGPQALYDIRVVSQQSEGQPSDARHEEGREEAHIPHTHRRAKSMRKHVSMMSGLELC
mmetsp:Transcript_99673/g.277592  ORF Transcript_99673/g.277592 Transcript_99673/m.277592 type:complete len:223 (-) Transcript_99673:34-702(-)